MTTNVVSDERLGILARRQYDLFRRVREGTLPVERVLVGLQSMIEGQFDAIPQGLRRTIDCDASPWCPNNWKVEEHKKGGKLEFDPSKVELYLSSGQRGEKTIEGHKLRKELEGKQVMNACVLDHLLANTNLIPENWKQDKQVRTNFIYFWGTVYRDSVHNLYVRFLYFNGGKWSWDCYWLDCQWGAQDPAAVSAS